MKYIVPTIVLIGISGWFLNIYKIIKAPVIIEWGGLELMRFVGVFFAPFGAIIGWF